MTGGTCNNQINNPLLLDSQTDTGLMKNRLRRFAVKVTISLIGLLFLLSSGCKTKEVKDDRFLELMSLYNAGNFFSLAQSADSIKRLTLSSDINRKIDSLLDLAARFRLEFSLTEKEVDSLLNDRLIQFSDEDKQRWERANWLEYMVIDGEKLYFKRTVTNLELMLKYYGHYSYLANPFIINNEDSSKLSNVRKILEVSSGRGEPVLPVQMQLEYSINLLPGSVLPGELVRCWLPFPRMLPGRQNLLDPITFSPGSEIISPEDVPHRSVYMEQYADATGSADFFEKFIFESSAVWFNLEDAEILPYDTTALMYKEYTKEQPPHIVFNERINDLSDEVVGHENDPREIVRRIFYWIDGAIPWAGALEYGIIPDIPGYVLDNFRGDCGMKTLLFMTLARYNGIPVRWQSGWMLFPDEVNLHDWCEVYYEGLGWVPLDMSFGLMPSDDIREKEFYLSGLDGYRFTVNSDIGGKFHPTKRYLRSEPWDFQRGELESDARNLYFNQWRYRMNVVWLN